MLPAVMASMPKKRPFKPQLNAPKLKRQPLHLKTWKIRPLMLRRPKSTRSALQRKSLSAIRLRQPNNDKPTRSR